MACSRQGVPVYVVITVSSHLGYGIGESVPSPQHLVRAKHFSLAVEY